MGWWKKWGCQTRLGVPKKNGGVKRYKVKKKWANFFLTFLILSPKKPRPNFSNRPLNINPFQNLFYPRFKFLLSGGAIWNSFPLLLKQQNFPYCIEQVSFSVWVLKWRPMCLPQSSPPEYECGKRNPLYSIQEASFISIVIYLMHISCDSYSIIISTIPHSLLLSCFSEFFSPCFFVVLSHSFSSCCFCNILSNFIT